mmetsp:Transcript_20000/g.33860  ORF Transcript_20000/g.33860 Transcript_20000/m.33860 type:complete len:83 (-) Transcript_20000:204-452(-)
MWYYPQEDFSLTCDYEDALVRRSNDTLNPLGCEVSYDRKQVPFDMEDYSLMNSAKLQRRRGGRLMHLTLRLARGKNGHHYHN